MNMKKTPAPSTADDAELRGRAEARLKDKKQAQAGKGAAPSSADDTRRLLQELQIHQIELEMQNEELRRIQGDLEASRARCFDLYDLAPVCYCTLNEQGMILEANLAAATLLGATRGALIRQPLHRFILKEDQDIYYRRRKLLFETEAPQVCELRLGKKDAAAPVWVRIDATAAQDADGAPVCRATMIDITERIQKEEELRESEEHYRTLFEHANEAIFVVQDAKLAFVNPMTVTITGYSGEELASSPFTDFIHADDRDMVRDRYVRRLKGEDIPPRYSFRVLHKKGGFRWVELDAVIINWKGRPASLNFISDITERRRAEEKEKETHALLRIAGEKAKLGGWSVNLEENRVIWSDEVAVIHEMPAGHSPTLEQGISFYAPEWHERITKVFTDCAQKGIPYDEEMEIITAGGKRVWVRTIGEAVKDKAGKIIKVQGAFQDITERKRVEEELRGTLERLRKSIAATIQVMVSAVEARDPYTAGHQNRVADLARAIATEMGLPQEKIEGIRMAGSIHDIGKLSIPAEILSKPTKLTNLEFSLIKEHSRTGFEMLKDVESPWPLAQIVYQHHERMDGSGYPGNLKGDEIIVEARIMAVADVVEAMASHRPYRPAIGIDEALEEIEKNKGTLYDDTVAEACLRLFREKGFQLERAWLFSCGS
jgi:PAS domain S-box-containing protein/putative nucleotidyltransferase with HDIG domain